MKGNRKSLVCGKLEMGNKNAIVSYLKGVILHEHYEEPNVPSSFSWNVNQL